MLYESGAKEVHVRIACPEIKFPDFYGVDMPTKKELLSSDKNTEEICDFLKVRISHIFILAYLRKHANKGCFSFSFD